MLTFLSPLFLAGALAAAIPLLIHLSRSRRTKTMRFSTTRFFTDEFLRSYRMSRLKELWLLAVRMALFALFAAALARPLLMPRGRAWFDGGARAVVVVLDNSASMGLTENGVSLFDRARASAREIVAGLKPGDTVSLVLAGRRAGGPEVVFPQATPALGDALQAIDAARVATLGTDLSAAVARAEAVALASPAESKEVYVLSDLQSRGWQAPEESTAPSGSVQLVFLKVGPARPENVAVTAVQYAAARPTAGVPFTIRPHLTAQGGDPSGCDLTLVVDGKPVASRRVGKLRDGRWAVPRFDHTFTTGGWHTGYVEAADPKLTQDNRRYFALEVNDSLRVLAVDGAPSQVARLDELFFLKLALTSNPEGRGAVRVDVVSPTGLTGADFGNDPLVVLANVETLPPPAVEAIEGYVDRGGSLLVFLGDQVGREFYNATLAAPTRLHGGLMPGRLLGREGDPAGAADVATVGAVDDAHPALASFQDPQFAGLSNVGFRCLWGIEPGPTSAVLMRASNGSPLLLSKPFGKGRVMAFASTCDRDWTSFPVRPAFLPWLHRLVGFLAQEPLGRSGFFATGSSVPVPVSASEGLPLVTVKTPAGRVASPVASGDPAEPFAFNETEEAGVYTLLDPARPDAPRSFAVNLESDESDLTYLDDDLAAGPTPAVRTARVEAGLRDLLPGRRSLAYVADSAGSSATPATVRRGWPLWDGLLGVVLALALVEPLIANRINRKRQARPRDPAAGAGPRPTGGTL